MSKWHELTAKLEYREYWSTEKFLVRNDEIIRQWLEEKRLEILFKTSMSERDRNVLRDCLGLSPTEPEKGDGVYGGCPTPKESEGGEWNEHFVLLGRLQVIANELLKFTRPKKLSLAEKFADTFKETSSSYKCKCDNPKQHAAVLAEIATQHFKDER